MSRRPIVFFSPLPPQRNGIADYTASFMDALTAAFDVYLVSPDEAEPLSIVRATHVSLTDYKAFEGSFGSLLHVYQIGNNVDHAYMLPIMERCPGLTTLHDLSIHHLIDHIIAGGATGQAYEEIMLEAYGTHGAELAREVRRRQERALVFHMELGFIRSIAQRSQAMVTHSLTGKLRIAAAAPDMPVFRIPHPYQARASVYQGDRRAARQAARTELGLPPDAVILLSLGFVTRAKRIDLSLEAVALLRDNDHDVVYVVAGALNPLDYDLQRDIARLGLQDRVIVREYVPDAHLLDYFAAADIVINLRYPTMGETSGSLTNALALGCCVVVTAIGTYDEVPDDCVVKVPFFEMTIDGLARRLLPLVASTALREYHEVNALAYALRELTPATFVESYIQAIQASVATAGSRRRSGRRPFRTYKPTTSRRGIEVTARSLEAEGYAQTQMWWRSLSLPIREGAERLLVVGRRFDAELAACAFGWEGHLDGTDWAASAADTDYDVVLLTREAADFLASPLESLRAANAALGMGGLLILDVDGATAEDVDEHFPLALPVGATRQRDEIASAIGALLEAAGFRLERLVDRFDEIVFDGSSAEPDAASPEEGSEFCVRARKVSTVTVDHPPLVFRRY